MGRGLGLGLGSVVPLTGSRPGEIAAIVGWKDFLGFELYCQRFGGQRETSRADSRASVKKLA